MLIFGQIINYFDNICGNLDPLPPVLVDILLTSLYNYEDISRTPPPPLFAKDYFPKKHIKLILNMIRYRQIYGGGGCNDENGKVFGKKGFLNSAAAGYFLLWWH